MGETIHLVTRQGGGVDDDGYPLPEEVVNTEIPGAVFIPESTGTIHRNDGTLTYQQASVLLPKFEDIGVGAELQIRGESFVVERPSVQHRSAFGTSRGGTEIFVKRRGA